MSAYRFKFTVEHMIGRQEVELTVAYLFTPGRPATPPSYSHGGLPPEDAEVEIESIQCNGQPAFLSDEEEDALLRMAIERSQRDWEDEQAAEADYRYEQYRDRQMMAQWERDL